MLAAGNGQVKHLRADGRVGTRERLFGHDGFTGQIISLADNGAAAPTHSQSTAVAEVLDFP